MNAIVRLFFVIGFAIFVYGFTSSDKLSAGQSLMLWSLVPAFLMVFVSDFYTKSYENEVIAIAAMFGSVFFVMLCTGIRMQTGDGVYGFFALGGLALFSCSVVLLLTALYTKAVISKR